VGAKIVPDEMIIMSCEDFDHVLKVCHLKFILNFISTQQVFVYWFFHMDIYSYLCIGRSFHGAICWSYRNVVATNGNRLVVADVTHGLPHQHYTLETH
jgi:hypothetical protein